MEVKTPEQKQLETVDIPAVEIFSEGSWNGDIYSHDDLQAMVDAFDKVGFEPTIKAGHADGQEDEKKARLVFGAPALGYAKRIYLNGKKLIADLTQIPRRFADLIKAGAFKKISAEIYWSYRHEASGKTFPRVLKSVAFLGAEIPALTNLDAIESLYEKNVAGGMFAYDENKNEFRLYQSVMEMPSITSSYDFPRFLTGLRRKAKADVNFVDMADPDVQCDGCKYYLDAYDACTLVEGYIEEDDGCDLFEADTENYASKQKIKDYTIEKRGEEWCLIAKSTGKTLGCHDTEEGAMAQEKAVQANKNEEDNMSFKTHMTRDEIANICASCGESMREKGISALTFSDEQVAKFAGMDMAACMADAAKVKEYPDEGKRKIACQTEMDKAVMQAIQETKGGPNMDEKKFQEEKIKLEADKTAAEAKAKEYQDKLIALEASNEEARQKESEALTEVKKLKRERYDDQVRAWIAEQKSPAKGKIAPVEEPRILAIFSALYEDSRVVKFSQDGKENQESLMDAIKTFISKRPNIYKEMSFATPEPGESMDNPGDELNRLTLEYQRKNSVKEYSVAFKAVQKENPELTRQWLALQQ